jgi:hypothetical protein
MDPSTLLVKVVFPPEEKKTILYSDCKFTGSKRNS